MDCRTCGSGMVVFQVPTPLREHAPDGWAAALCSNCLRTEPAVGADPDTDLSDPPFHVVHDSFPGGEGGAALALAIGLLDSLALHRAAIQACCAHAESAGVDVLLTLDRLAEARDIDPHFDVVRRRSQLASFL